jgi:hypothetical protein
VRSSVRGRPPPPARKGVTVPRSRRPTARAVVSQLNLGLEGSGGDDRSAEHTVVPNACKDGWPNAKASKRAGRSKKEDGASVDPSARCLVRGPIEGNAASLWVVPRGGCRELAGTDEEESHVSAVEGLPRTGCAQQPRERALRTAHRDGTPVRADQDGSLESLCLRGLRQGERDDRDSYHCRRNCHVRCTGEPVG